MATQQPILQAKTFEPYLTGIKILQKPEITSRIVQQNRAKIFNYLTNLDLTQVSLLNKKNSYDEWFNRMIHDFYDWAVTSLDIKSNEHYFNNPYSMCAFIFNSYLKYLMIHTTYLGDNIDQYTYLCHPILSEKYLSVFEHCKGIKSCKEVKDRNEYEALVDEYYDFLFELTFPDSYYYDILELKFGYDY